MARLTRSRKIDPILRDIQEAAAEGFFELPPSRMSTMSVDEIMSEISELGPAARRRWFDQNSNVRTGPRAKRLSDEPAKSKKPKWLSR